MLKFEQKQEVKQFADEDTLCEQVVVLSPDDECEPWMLISHAGNEFSLSVSNWKSLVQLGNSVLEKAKTHDLQS